MLTRRRLLTTAAAVPPTAAFVASSASDAAQAAEAASVAGKNILIFITDQQRKTMHFPAGWEEKNLPGLTRLKQNGVSFENAFCNTAMCSPSRATLFTGLYPAQHGVKYTLEEDMPADQYPQVELSTDFVNLASVMKAAGYEVVYKGKWHLSKPIGEDWAPEDLARYGFDRWSPPDGGSNQDIDQAGGGTVDHDGHYMYDDGAAEDGAEGVLKFINSRAGATQPWCLIVALVNPHDVLLYPGPANMTPPKYVQAGYDESWLVGDIGLPVTFHEDLSTKPTCQKQFRDLFGASGPLPNQQMKINYLNFYGNLLKLADQYLVDILDALDATAQTDDTVVVRTADHGEMGLAHGMRQKSFNAYEETIHMPLIFSNPQLYPKARRVPPAGLPRRPAADPGLPGGGPGLGPQRRLGGDRLLPPRARARSRRDPGPGVLHLRRLAVRPVARPLHPGTEPHRDGPGEALEAREVLRRGGQEASRVGDVRPEEGPARAPQPRLPTRQDDPEAAGGVPAAEALDQVRREARAATTSGVAPLPGSCGRPGAIVSLRVEQRRS